ncbi:MAG: glycogen debranching N-terminal domain-containing protein, partial [Candidatus Limnocylindrales bacterium]
MDVRPTPIARATDLGSVQVLKHGNLFLLTDAFGDIHNDSRGLGLYRGDTRLLSCSVLRVGGGRAVLLQTSVGGNFRGGIQMTNPSADRNPAAKVDPASDLTGRTIGIGRDRMIGNGALSERLRIVNHGSHPATIPVELELGADGADIFEVRGYPRERRGRLLPVAVTDRRVTFRYDGLDGLQRLTHVAFSDPALSVEPVTEFAADGSDTGATIRLRWVVELGSGQTRDLRWVSWATDRPEPSAARDTATTAADTAAL